MKSYRLVSASLAAAAVSAMLVSPSSANAEVYVVRPRPIIVAPPPPPPPPGIVYVAPYPAVPACGTRTVRVWVNGTYVNRVVRTC